MNLIKLDIDLYIDYQMQVLIVQIKCFFLVHQKQEFDKEVNHTFLISSND